MFTASQKDACPAWSRLPTRPAIEKKFFRPCFKGSGVEGRVLRNDGCIWTKSCPPRKNTSKLTTYTHLNIWHLLILSKKKLKCKFCVSLFEKGFSHPDFFRSSESKSTGKPENEFFSRAFAAEEKFEWKWQRFGNDPEPCGVVLTAKLQKNPEIYMKKYVEKSPTQRKTLKAGKHEFFLSNSNAEQRSISIGRAEPTAWNCGMKFRLRIAIPRLSRGQSEIQDTL